MEFAGTYENTSTDDYERYLAEIGVGLATRKIEGSSKPTVEIQQDGPNLKIKTTTTLKTVDLAFTLGKEFTEVVEGGGSARTTFTADANTLTQVRKLDTVTATITHIFDDTGFTVTFQANGAVAKRTYVRRA